MGNIKYEECRLCTNCYKNYVDESKQNFTYRDAEGNKWMASVRPICDECVSEGEYKDENGFDRLHIGASRRYKSNKCGYGMSDSNEK